jgi:outer membrane protein OmpA-like peptidoglycan-associated protein
MAMASVPRVSQRGGLDMLVNFKLGSAQLTSQAQAEARAFAQAMSAPQMAGMRFTIEGHTDASGSRDKNMALSQARAQSVVDYLVGQGVDAGRLTARGYGPDKPVQGKRPSSPINRRVEFVKQA